MLSQQSFIYDKDSVLLFDEKKVISVFHRQ